MTQEVNLISRHQFNGYLLDEFSDGSVRVIDPKTSTYVKYGYDKGDAQGWVMERVREDSVNMNFYHNGSYYMTRVYTDMSFRGKPGGMKSPSDKYLMLGLM